VLDVLTGFVAELRAAGLPVSLTESLDAAEAVHHVPLEDREALKYALAATLVKSATHWKAFETAFEVYFALRGSQYEIDTDDGAATNRPDENGEMPPGDGQGRQGGGGGEGLSPEELAEMLYRALMNANEAQIAALARQAVARFAGMEPGRPVGGTYYLYRTLRNLDLDGVLERLMDQARRDAPQGLTHLEERLAQDEFQSRLDRLRKEIEDEIRRKLVADRGTEALARSLRKPLPEDIDFMHATREELASLRRAIAPLTRKLAVRLARKRRHGRKGALDFRSTMRHSLSTGGVPVDPQFRYPRPAKPEIIVIADISGSVAAIHRINTEADVVWVDGHSDYGHALSVFWDRWGDEITPRASVLLLGDARNNYHATQSWVVQEIRHRARHVYWLNPEPRAYWDTGDSVVGEYAVHCDEVFECRNLRQLERFVSELA